MSLFMLWLSSHFTNALYFVQLERRRGTAGSGSSSTSLENLDEYVSSDEELPKKGQRSFEVMHQYI